MDAAMAASKSRWYTRESTLRSGRGCQTHAGLAIHGTGFFVLFSLPPPPLLLLLLHLLLHLFVHLLRNYHLCPALSRSASTISSLSATSWLLARALSSFFPLLEGTTFFLVAPAMGGTQNGLCPTNEKRDHGNASPRVLRQWRLSSSTTHRSHPSLSLAIPHRSLALPRRSPSPFGRSAVLLSPRAASMLHSSRASFLLRILIFFINFSPSSPDGSPSSSLSLSLSLRLPISLQSLADLGISSLFRVHRPEICSPRASTGCTTDCPSRKRPTYLVPSLGLRSRANVLVPSREAAFVRHTRHGISFYISFPSQMFCFFIFFRAFENFCEIAALLKQ